MTVTLREKEGLNGTSSLFLDIYHKGVRRKESLKLKVYQKPKNTQERNHNKETRILAESIRADRYLTESKRQAGVFQEFKVGTDFLTYFKRLTDDRFDSKGNYGNWDSTYKILKQYINGQLTFKDIDREWVMRFKQYLDKEHRGRGNQQFSQATKHSYFNKLKACFNQAVIDKIIPSNPAHGVKGFRLDKGANRVYLDEGELGRAIKAECDSELLKQAFLFSCFTGIRHGDLMSLKWRDVELTSPEVPYVRLKQNKTQTTLEIPLNENAMSLMGMEGHADEKIFPGLKYSSEMNIKLSRWMLRAGITKKVTFHSARHTFATLLLTEDTNMRVIQKLLGHSELKTTEIYAKVIDKKKQEAINRLPKFDL
jgi:integrase